MRSQLSRKSGKVIDVNLTGPFLCAREFATLARATAWRQPWSTSTRSAAGNPGRPTTAPKGGARRHDSGARAQPLRDRTGAIAPGPVDTPILLQMPGRAGSVGWSLSVALPTPKRCIRRSSSSLADFFTGRCLDSTVG